MFKLLLMETEVKSNRIMQVILEKASEANDSSLVAYYKRKLRDYTGRSFNSISHILHNKEQPSGPERAAIAKALKTNIDRIFPDEPV